MHWEVWALDTGNLIAAPATEAEVLAPERQLLGKAWRSEDLSLMLEDEARLVEELPPALSGLRLGARASADDSASLSA